MADSFQLNLGSLRSSVQLTLHTHHASRLWFGRPRGENGKPGMIGLSGFANIINRIKQGAAQDDPYSDWFLLMIEERIEEASQQLKDIDSKLDEVMACLPAQLSVSNNLSVQPMTLPLYLTSPLAYKGVYLLTSYDELVRRILLANHIGLIDNHTKEAWLDEGSAILRRLFGLGQRYKGFSGASRDDFAANNARAQAAREMYAFLGELPADVLDGSRRSKYAPDITRANTSRAVEDDEDHALDQPAPDFDQDEA